MDLLPSRARPATLKAARLADETYGATAQPDWRDITWYDHLNWIEIRGRRVNYVDIGNDTGQPPVVFVHGLGGAWQNWLENIPRLAQERRVIALDLPGFGQSDMPAADITISGYGRTVRELCKQLGIGPVVLVGNSMGGFVAAETAIQYPDLVERLVLISAAGITITNISRRPVQTWGRVAAFLGTYGAANSRAAIVRPAIRQFSLGFVMRHPTRIRSDLCWELIHASGTPGFLPALEALMDYDFRDRLGEISCPTWIVWGEDDMLVPVKDADEFERRIPNSRKIVMKDTGHVPMIERPVTFNDALIEFLAEPREAPQAEAEATV